MMPLMPNDADGGEVNSATRAYALSRMSFFSSICSTSHFKTICNAEALNHRDLYSMHSSEMMSHKDCERG